VIEQHSIGFEPKSNMLGQRGAFFLWQKKRSDAILKQFKGIVGGLHRICVQFDHTIKYVVPDPKNYSREKWETIIERLMWWAGPVGFMYMALSKTYDPFLPTMLGQQVRDDRDLYIGPHLNQVLDEFIPKSMGSVEVEWSDRIFVDAKLAWDMAKALMVQGPLSLTTALKEGGFKPDKEEEYKTEEAKPENRTRVLPIYDAAHGNRNGSPAQAGAGRPASGARSNPPNET
jgi:hypothetical protein